jgi:hypothetical protein
VIVLLESVFSGHLWKPRISRRFLYLSLIIAASGAVLEVTKYLNHATGMTIVVMGIPLYYLANFQLFRLIFKKYYQTEPFVVSAGSVIGSPPLDLFTSENKDDKNRKFEKDRKILAADFAFSLAANLVPALVIYYALYLIREFNK